MREILWNNFRPFPMLLLTIVMGLIGGCSASALLSKVSGAERYLAAKDVPYGQHANQKMDVYRPRSSSGTEVSSPCKIMFVYGGSWQNGDKASYGFVAASLAEAGYTVAVPDYRKYPDAVFPEFVHDLAMAAAHPLFKKINDSSRLVLIGHSAGALNAAHLAYDPQYLRALGAHYPAVDILISVAGPHDFFLPSTKKKWQAIFGKTADKQIQALSVNHVSRNASPTLILHGEKDSVVTPRSAHSLASKLATHEVDHVAKIYPNVGHRRIIAAMAPPLSFLAPTRKDIINFLNENECHPASDFAS